MEEALVSLWNGLPFFVIHSATSLVMLLVGIFIYTLITPHDELKLIREGNVAAATTLGGAIVGLSLPVAFSMASSMNVWDIVVWGVIALLFQLAAFRLVDLFLKDLSQRIENGEMGPAIILVSFKLATAAINSAAISG